MILRRLQEIIGTEHEVFAEKKNWVSRQLYHVRLNTYNICGPKAEGRGQKRCDPASASDARECAPREAEGKEQG